MSLYFKIKKNTQKSLRLLLVMKSKSKINIHTISSFSFLEMVKRTGNCNSTLPFKFWTKNPNTQSHSSPTLTTLNSTLYRRGARWVHLRSSSFFIYLRNFDSAVSLSQELWLSGFIHGWEREPFWCILFFSFFWKFN